MRAWPLAFVLILSGQTAFAEDPSPHSAHLFTAMHSPAIFAEVDVRVEAGPNTATDHLLFTALQTTFSEEVVAHGGLMTNTGGFKANWGALGPNKYDLDTPAKRLEDLEVLQNMPGRVSFAKWEIGRWYRYQISRGPVITLPAGNYAVQDEAPIYVDHPRTLREWKFKATDRETGQVMYSQSIYANGDTITDFMYWSETIDIPCTQMMKIRWENPTYKVENSTTVYAPKRIIGSLQQSTCDRNHTTAIERWSPKTQGVVQTFGAVRAPNVPFYPNLYPSLDLLLSPQVGRTLPSLWKEGRWTVQNENPSAIPFSTPFGEKSDIALPGDYDGDGVDDLAFYRPTDGTIHVAGQTMPRTFGKVGDVPVPADYNGDGKIDLAVLDKSKNILKIEGMSDTPLSLGNDDLFVPGDYTRSGAAQAMVFEAKTGTWRMATIGSGANKTVLVENLGQIGDAPVPADYDGDGALNPAVYSPQTFTWTIAYTSPLNNSWVNRKIAFGQKGDIAAPGDYNGDGISEIAVYRPQTGEFHGWAGDPLAPWAWTSGQSSADGYPVTTRLGGILRVQAAVLPEPDGSQEPGNIEPSESSSGGGCQTAPLGALPMTGLVLVCLMICRRKLLH